MAYAVMPYADYQDACEAVREKTGGTEVIKSGDLGTQIRAIESGGASIETCTVTFDASEVLSQVTPSFMRLFYTTLVDGVPTSAYLGMYEIGFTTGGATFQAVCGTALVFLQSNTLNDGGLVLVVNDNVNNCTYKSDYTLYDDASQSTVAIVIALPQEAGATLDLSVKVS